MSVDTQKAAVYEWEGLFQASRGRTLSPAETRRLIRRCCRHYGVPVPAIKLLPRNSQEWSYYDSADEVLAMNWKQCNEFIVCHEAAHAIVDALDDEEAEDHGPEFLGIYITLLVENEVAPRSALEASAREMGLTWIAPIP